MGGLARDSPPKGNLTGSSWSYDTWSPASTGTYPYTIFIQDYAGLWNATFGTLEVTDTTPPTYTLVTESADPLTLGGTETVTITGVTDLSGIQTLKIAIAGSNYTMIDQGSGTWVYNTWVPISAGAYPYVIYLQDTAGNTNAIPGSIEVKETSSIPAFSGLFLILAFGLLASLGLLKRRVKP